MDDERIIWKIIKYMNIMIITITIITIVIYSIYFIIQVILDLETRNILRMSLIQYILFSTHILNPKMDLGRFQDTGLIMISISVDILAPLHWYSIYSLMKNRNKKKKTENYKITILKLSWLSFTILIWLFALWNTFLLWVLGHAKYPG